MQETKAGPKVASAEIVRSHQPVFLDEQISWTYNLAI